MIAMGGRFASAPGSVREHICDHWRTIWEKNWELADTLQRSSASLYVNLRLMKRTAWNNWNRPRRPIRSTSFFSIPGWCYRNFRPWLLHLKVPPVSAMAAQSTCLNSAKPQLSGYLPDKGNCWLSQGAWRERFFNLK